MAKEKWIQGAIKRPGRIQRLCRRLGHKSVSKSCLDELERRAKKRGDRSLLSAVNLARRFKYGDLSKRA